MQAIQMFIGIIKPDSFRSGGNDIAGPNSFERYRRVFYITLWKYIPSVLLGD